MLRASLTPCYLSPYVTPILRASPTLSCLPPSPCLFDVAITCPDLRCLGQFSIFTLTFCRFPSMFSPQPEPQNDTVAQNSKLARSKADLETCMGYCTMVWLPGVGFAKRCSCADWLHFYRFMAELFATESSSCKCPYNGLMLQKMASLL